MPDIRAHWPERLAGHTDLLERLIEAYDEPRRGYHALTHLTEVFARIEEILSSGPDDLDRDAVLLAAWFHDAVYEDHGDNEERSAVLAERELTGAGADRALVDEVARLVRLTEHHRVLDHDLPGAVLCDADLAILAADGERYASYVAGVRYEYAAVPYEDFRRGRAQVLRSLLEAPTLFATSYAHEHWEAAARANLTRELADLES